MIQVGDNVNFKRVKAVPKRLQGCVAKIIHEEPLYYIVRYGMHGEANCYKKDLFDPADHGVWNTINSRVRVVSDCKSKGRIGTIIKTRYQPNPEESWCKICVQLDATSNEPSRKVVYDFYSVERV